MSKQTHYFGSSETIIARVFVLGTTFYLLLHCWVTSAVKPLWMDEIISYTLITDPSLPHALAALAHGADGGFPSYYCIAWPIAHVFSASELSIRLLSGLFMAGAFGLLFGLLRRAYGLFPAMLAVVMSIGGSTLILYQNSEVRFYADLFFSAMVAIRGYEQLFRSAGERRWPVSAMVLSAAGHGLLVLCHPFGIAYSAAISLAAVVAFLWVRPKNLLLPYLTSACVGDAFFLLWIRGFLQQTRIVVGQGSLPVPSVADFFRIYAQLAPSLYYDDRTKVWAASHLLPLRQHLPAVSAIFIGTVSLIVLVALARKELFFAQSTALRTERSGLETAVAQPKPGAYLLILAVTLVLVPAGVWVTSHLGKSLFIHRYFIPSILGFAIIYSGAFARLGRWLAARPDTATAVRKPLLRKLATVVAMLVVTGVYVAWPLAAASTAPDGRAALRTRIARDVDYGLPEACEPANTFWQLSHYAPSKPFWFVLDREVAFDPRNGLAAPSEFIFTSALRDFYPSLHLLRTEEFLRRFPEFIVDNPSGSLWYMRRLRGDPAYTATPVPGSEPAMLRLVRTPMP